MLDILAVVQEEAISIYILLTWLRILIIVWFNVIINSDEPWNP